MGIKFGFGKRTFKQSKIKDNMLQQDESTHLLTASSDFFITEAYKTLRTNVTFSLTGEDDSKVIVMTSSFQSEGKSTTAVNLAISFVQTDKRVIVIDCDLRRPKLSRLMNVNAPAGLSNVIMKPGTLEAAIIHHEESGLDLLLAGDIPPNPSELLGSERMQRIINRLKESYDYIILDTPPVNMVTDSTVLAPLSDGVLFVVRAGQTDRGAVVHAVEQLEYAKAKILGFVLNGVNMGSTSYGGYGKYKYRYKKYGYGYGYGYGQSASSRSGAGND